MPKRLVASTLKLSLVATQLHPPLHNVTSRCNSGSKIGSRGQGTCLLKNKRNYVIRSVAGSRVGATRTQFCFIISIFQSTLTVHCFGFKITRKAEFLFTSLESLQNVLHSLACLKEWEFRLNRNPPHFFVYYLLGLRHVLIKNSLSPAFLRNGLVILVHK